MFGIKVNYLLGSVTAADIKAGQEKNMVEWPPHPDRLFCALVQAWGDLGEPEAGSEALLWLERLPAPHITCGKVLYYNNSIVNPIVYVPVNENVEHMKHGSPIQGTQLLRLRQGRRFAKAPLSDPRVIFWWPDAELEHGLRQALTEIVSAVARLGHSSSLVHAEIVDRLEELELTFLPDPDGNRILRLPYPGRLNELRKAYEYSYRPPITHRWATYSEQGGEHKKQGSHVEKQGNHGEMFIFRLNGDRSFSLPIEYSGTIIDVWRRALIREADQPPSVMITGHDPESTEKEPKPLKRPHMALLPLADVGHQYARAHIMGLAATLPVGIDSEERKSCLTALRRVKRLNLGKLGEWSLEPCDASEHRKALQVKTWTQPSKVWGSVTPFVFGKYPKRLWCGEGEKIIREACLIAGLPEPTDICISQYSFVLGVPPSFKFPCLPEKPGRPKRFHVHVRLDFKEEVRGPVLVGVGRHRGYGLFRQLEGIGND